MLYIAKTHGISPLQKFYIGTGFEKFYDDNLRDIEKKILKNL
jgi:hypothetical protein